MQNAQDARNVLKLSAAIIVAAAGGYLVFGGHNKVERVDAATVRTENAVIVDNPKKARAAFNEAVKVFFSARCINCHPDGDNPLQGNESKVHEPEVLRGIEGRGTEDIQCAMCHLETNTDGENMPPGVPDWHMPPTAHKMIFQGLTAAQLCSNLKDPQKNGGKKSAKEAVEHLGTDPKVLWAWNPGTNRTIPPMSHEDFLKKMNDWVVNGAACPK